MDLLIEALAVILSLLRAETDQIWCFKSGISQVILDLVDCGDSVLAMIMANPLARMSMDDLVTVAKHSSDHCIMALALDRIVNCQHPVILPEQHMPQSLSENCPLVFARINGLLANIHEDGTESIPSMAVVNSALQLHGIALAEEHRSGKLYSLETKLNVERWIRMLRLAVDEGSVGLPWKSTCITFVNETIRVCQRVWLQYLHLRAFKERYDDAAPRHQQTLICLVYI